MEQKGNNHGPSNGFLLGLIVGVLLALLFTTKKGRKILKIVTEEGLDKISNLEAIIEEQFGKEEKKYSTENVVGDADEDEVPLGQSDYVVQPAATPSQREEKKSELDVQMAAPAQVHEETAKQEKKSTNPISKFTSHSRRFFRGVPKKK